MPSDAVRAFGGLLYLNMRRIKFTASAFFIFLKLFFRKCLTGAEADEIRRGGHGPFFWDRFFFSDALRSSISGLLPNGEMRPIV